MESWRNRNRDRWNTYRRAWYQKNKDRARLYDQRKRAKNPEKYRELSNARSRRYRMKLGESYKEYTTNRTRTLKAEVIAAYGGKCECCGNTAFEFLTIDHINGRQGEIEEGVALYRKLKKLGWPKENHRLLCMNCNFSYGHYGYCPHSFE